MSFSSQDINRTSRQGLDTIIAQIFIFAGEAIKHLFLFVKEMIGMFLGK